MMLPSLPSQGCFQPDIIVIDVIGAVAIGEMIAEVAV
jgi:hypothetical protein